MFNNKKFVLKGLVLSVIAVFFFAGIVISCEDDKGSGPDLPQALQNTIWINDNKDMLIFTTNTVTVKGSSEVYTLQNIVNVAGSTQLQFTTSAPIYAIAYNDTTFTYVKFENFESNQTANWREASNAEIDEGYLAIGYKSLSWKNTDNSDTTYIVAIGPNSNEDPSVGMYLKKNTSDNIIASYTTIIINDDNTLSCTDNSENIITINYSFNNNYSKLTLSGFTGELVAFNLTYSY